MAFIKVEENSIRLQERASVRTCYIHCPSARIHSRIDLYVLLKSPRSQRSTVTNGANNHGKRRRHLINQA